MEMIKTIANWKLERIILFFLLVFGTLYIIVTPPFEVPDSPNHLYRSYQLSQGDIVPVTKDSTVGGFVPRSLDSIEHFMRRYRFNAYAKISDEDLDDLSEIELNQDDSIYAHFPNTALYSPISYFPQTIAVFIGTRLKLSAVNLHYLTRVFSFLFWFMLMYFTLRYLPIKKHLLGILMLLPTSLYINSSYSADMITNGLCFLYLAIILYVSFEKKEFTSKLKLLLTALIVCVGLSKLVYIPIVLLTLLIPISKFSSKKGFLIFFFVSCIIGGGSALVWKKYIDSVYTPYLSYNSEARGHVTLGYKADMNKQMQYIKDNKIKTVKTFSTSYAREFSSNFSSYINIFGWNRFELSSWFTILAYLIIFLFAIGHTSDVYFLSIKQKIILLSFVMSSTLLVMLSQYLTWNEVGGDKLYPLMGRYFTPIYPMLFLIFSSKKFRLNRKFAISLFLLYTIFSGIFSLFKMDEFFNSHTTHKLVWEYDFSVISQETLANEQLIDEVKIDGNKNFVILDSTTNDFAIELSPNNRFAYTISIPNVGENDKVEVSCWRNEEEITFVFDDWPNSNYYVATSYSENVVEGDFEFVSNMYYCTENFEILKIYLYNPSDNIGLAKDFKIKYYRSN